MPDELTKPMEAVAERAEALTEMQIQTALRLNARHFDGAGLEMVPAILQALAQNYHAERLNAKVVK